MALSFFRNFAATKGDSAIAGVAKALVRLDPEAAGKADLKSLEQDLDKAGDLIVGLRRDLSTEQKELDVIQHQYEQMMGAAEVLKAKIAGGNFDSSLTASLESLVGRLEQIVPELERDQKAIAETHSGSCFPATRTCCRRFASPKC